MGLAGGAGGSDWAKHGNAENAARNAGETTLIPIPLNNSAPFAAHKGPQRRLMAQFDAGATGPLAQGFATRARSR